MCSQKCFTKKTIACVKKRKIGLKTFYETFLYLFYKGHKESRFLQNLACQHRMSRCTQNKLMYGRGSRCTHKIKSEFP
jgi:hypothetical protein